MFLFLSSFFGCVFGSSCLRPLFLSILNLFSQSVIVLLMCFSATVSVSIGLMGPSVNHSIRSSALARLVLGSRVAAVARTCGLNIVC